MSESLQLSFALLPFLQKLHQNDMVEYVLDEEKKDGEKRTNLVLALTCSFFSHYFFHTEKKVFSIVFTPRQIIVFFLLEQQTEVAENCMFFEFRKMELMHAYNFHKLCYESM